MQFIIEDRENLVIIKLPDTFLSATTKSLKEELVALNNRGKRNVVLDFSDTTTLGATGLSAIVQGNTLCKNSMGYCVLINVNNSILNLIKMAQLSNVLNIKNSLEEATIFMFND